MCAPVSPNGTGHGGPVGFAGGGGPGGAGALLLLRFGPQTNDPPAVPIACPRLHCVRPGVTAPAHLKRHWWCLVVADLLSPTPIHWNAAHCWCFAQAAWQASAVGVIRTGSVLFMHCTVQISGFSTSTKYKARGKVSVPLLTSSQFAVSPHSNTQPSTKSPSGHGAL